MGKPLDSMKPWRCERIISESDATIQLQTTAVKENTALAPPALSCRIDLVHGVSTVFGGFIGFISES